MSPAASGLLLGHCLSWYLSTGDFLTAWWNSLARGIFPTPPGGGKPLLLPICALPCPLLLLGQRPEVQGVAPHHSQEGKWVLGQVGAMWEARLGPPRGFQTQTEMSRGTQQGLGPC